MSSGIVEIGNNILLPDGISGISLIDYYRQIAGRMDP
jgi:hypothetical protein